jgi:lipoprotein-anchoring transpeptidase ErfK/SrfK
MTGMRRAAAVLGAGVILAALAGCSSDSLPSLTDARQAGVSTGAAAVSPTHTPAPTPTPTPTPVSIVPSCVGTPAGVKHIYVSISEQSLSACTGPVLVTSTAVTTGASALTNVHDATPVGTWRIYSKVQNTVLTGRDANGSWRDPVAYWMPFYGAYGFHDASWQTFPFGSPLYTTQGSHGCVHVPVAELGALFNWTPTGTLVTIQS